MATFPDTTPMSTPFFYVVHAAEVMTIGHATAIKTTVKKRLTSVPIIVFHAMSS